MSTTTFLSPFCYVEINEPIPNLNLFQLSFVCLSWHTFALQLLFRIMNPEQALAKTRWWFARLSNAGRLIIHYLELIHTKCCVYIQPHNNDHFAVYFDRYRTAFAEYPIYWATRYAWQHSWWKEHNMLKAWVSFSYVRRHGNNAYSNQWVILQSHQEVEEVVAQLCTVMILRLEFEVSVLINSM